MGILRTLMYLENICTGHRDRMVGRATVYITIPLVLSNSSPYFLFFVPNKVCATSYCNSLVFELQLCVTLRKEC